MFSKREPLNAFIVCARVYISLTLSACTCVCVFVRARGCLFMFFEIVMNYWPSLSELIVVYNIYIRIVDWEQASHISEKRRAICIAHIKKQQFQASGVGAGDREKEKARNQMRLQFIEIMSDFAQITMIFYFIGNLCIFIQFLAPPINFIFLFWCMCG